jgi:hypothetical protein
VYLSGLPGEASGPVCVALKRAYFQFEFEIILFSNEGVYNLKRERGGAEVGRENK